MERLRYYPVGRSWQRQPWAQTWIVPGYFPPEAIPPTTFIMAPPTPAPRLALDDPDAAAAPSPWVAAFLGGLAVWLFLPRR